MRVLRSIQGLWLFLSMAVGWHYKTRLFSTIVSLEVGGNEAWADAGLVVAYKTWAKNMV